MWLWRNTAAIYSRVSELVEAMLAVSKVSLFILHILHCKVQHINRKLQVGIWYLHLQQARALADLEQEDEVLQLDLVLAFGFAPVSGNIYIYIYIYVGHISHLSGPRPPHHL